MALTRETAGRMRGERMNQAVRDASTTVIRAIVSLSRAVLAGRDVPCLKTEAARLELATGVLEDAVSALRTFGLPMDPFTAEMLHRVPAVFWVRSHRDDGAARELYK